MTTVPMTPTNNHQPAHTPLCDNVQRLPVEKQTLLSWNNKCHPGIIIRCYIPLFQKPWSNLLKYPVYRILYYSPKCHCLSETSLAFGGVLFIKLYRPWYFQITEPASDNNEYSSDSDTEDGIVISHTNHFLNSNRLALSPVTRITSSLLIPLILPISSATSGRFNEQFLLPL